ncbi:hypothetical protein [Nocardia tengchongensis]
MRKQRIIWAIAVLALFGTGTAMLGVDLDRYYRLDHLQPWSTLACWTAAFVLLVAFAHRLARNHTKLWIACATLLGILTFPLWLISLLLVSSWPTDDDLTRIVQVQPSPDGRVQAVTETFYSLIDPSCRVWLREPDGLFARRILLWLKTESGCPTSASSTTPRSASTSATANHP